jgi:subfamily B ATP-binding cassette protein MsbA
MIVAVVCMIASSVFGGASLGMIIPFVDNVISGQGIPIPDNVGVPAPLVRLIEALNRLSPLALLNRLIIWTMLIFLLKELFIYCQSYFMNDLSQRVIRDIKNKIYKKFLGLSLDFYSEHPTGKLASRVTFDATVIKDSIAEGLTDLLYQPIQLVVFFIIILAIRSYFSISWLLIFVSIILLPSVIYPVMRIGRRLRKISEESQKKMGDITMVLFETISGMRIVKAFCMEGYEFRRFQKHNQKFYRLIMKTIKRMTAIRPVTEFIGIFCISIIAWLGAKEIAGGTLSAGAFVTFLAALLSLLRPFKRLSRVYGINQKALAAAHRIFEVLDTEPAIQEVPSPRTLEKIQENIIFEHVHFCYREGVEVLTDINLEVRAGEVVALVGPTGVGKTTLVNLVPRFCDASKGTIKIDGVDIREVSLRSLRDQIGMVTQDMILFNDTVANNISYGRTEKVDRKAVAEAAKIANAHLFVENLPQQYDTVIGEKGIRLSGGEKQRLAIARAIYKNPPLLILDEATSQLDTESERLVQEAIDRLMKGRTVFVIAHRLSTIRRADRIIVLDKGRITEVGDHDSLIKTGGLYKKLYEMQFAEE